MKHMPRQLRNLTSSVADDVRATPTSDELSKFALRLHELREAESRRPMHFDDEWDWFLSLFSSRRTEIRESDDRSSHRAA